MIFVAALANVMANQCCVEYFAIDGFGLEDRAGQRQIFGQFFALNLGQLADGLDRMLIHSVVVIHIELHHRDDRLKFGNKGGQDAQLVHPAQGAFWVAIIQQHPKKRILGPRVAPQRFVDDAKVTLDHAHGIGMNEQSRLDRMFIEFKN